MHKVIDLKIGVGNSIMVFYINYFSLFIGIKSLDWLQ